MAEMMNHVKTVNSSIRTLLMVVICGVLGYGGYLGYEHYVKPGQEAKQALADLAELQDDFEKQKVALQLSQAELTETNLKLSVAEELNDRLETSLKLLKVDRRIANIKVLEKGEDENGEPFMEVSFTEVDEQGDEIGFARNFILRGEKFYVDGWIATFEDKYIEQADELRSASLFVFKSIYGDAERPRDGQRLDLESMAAAPGIYQDEKKRDFEQQIWNDFWQVCNNEALQQELGIRTSQGQASYVMPEVGKTYQVKIRASGSMELDPVDVADKD